ncbi:matrixin family metalloprotease, partial [Agromyces humi]|uniref:matrixin family metalloprotease n=1 Tax=Agromyces humi TaxID=1766800 RepID=UPI00193A61A7
QAGVATAAPPPCGPTGVAQAKAADVSKLTACKEGSVVISDTEGPASVVLPAPGFAVEFSAITADGTAGVPDFTVYRSASGEVATRSESSRSNVVHGKPAVIAEFEAPAASESGILATSPKCDNYTYATYGPRWLATVSWYYKTPSFGGTASVFNAMSAMANGYGACGSNLSNSAAHSYAGTTTASATMSGGTCLAGNYQNVVDSGTPLASASTLAQTCTYMTATDIVASDIRINTAYSWYTGSSVTGCPAGNYDLQGVMTHEAGHLFGLTHVAGATMQVMKPTSAVCETGMRLLGNGDLAGMKYLYP